MKIAIIGGGAAGFFAAINVKQNYPNYEVTIFEKTTKILSKVKISGGGRCNVTNACNSISSFSKSYPRGEKQMKKLLQQFSNLDLQNWFQQKNIDLKTEQDGRVFPKSNTSKTIIDCFVNSCNQLNINILLKQNVSQIKASDNKIELKINEQSKTFDKVIVTTGGSNKIENYKWLQQIGLQIDEPIPSLFTFNMPNELITKLPGLVVENALVKIVKTKFKSEGSILITHWGMSGPGILKLSAFAAKDLFKLNYDFNIAISWLKTTSFEIVENDLKKILEVHLKKQIGNISVLGLPKRFWFYTLQKCEIDLTKKCSEIGKKDLNKLTTTLTNDIYKVKGKTTFKEEFVTCGGINLQEIDFKTMASKKYKNLYFAGELLNIDGITGGFNFQAAWSTAFLAAKLNN